MPVLKEVVKQWDHPDWSLTPEFNMLNHQRLSRELAVKYVPAINLIWGSKSASWEEFEESNYEEPRTIKTRDDYVFDLAQALEDNCLTPMADEPNDLDLAAAAHVLFSSTLSSPVLLPGPTSATIGALMAAGFDNITHLLNHAMKEGDKDVD